MNADPTGLRMICALSSFSAANSLAVSRNSLPPRSVSLCASVANPSVRSDLGSGLTARTATPEENRRLGESLSAVVRRFSPHRPARSRPDSPRRSRSQRSPATSHAKAPSRGDRPPETGYSSPIPRPAAWAEVLYAADTPSSARSGSPLKRHEPVITDFTAEHGSSSDQPCQSVFCRTAARFHLSGLNDFVTQLRGVSASVPSSIASLPPCRDRTPCSRPHRGRLQLPISFRIVALTSDATNGLRLQRSRNPHSRALAVRPARSGRAEAPPHAQAC